MPPMAQRWPWTRAALGGVAGLAVSASLGIALAQSPGQNKISADEARKRLEADKGRLEQTQRKKQEVQSDVERLAAERERINTRLLETGRLIQHSEGQLSLIEARLGELEQQEKVAREQLMASHGSISVLLAAMQRMGRNPPPVLVTRREDALSMVRSAMLLASAFPELRTEALALSSKLDDLVQVVQRIRSEGEKLRAETKRLEDARVRLAALQETKRQNLADREAELSSLSQAVSQIARNVQDFSELITGLDKEVSSRTGLGAYDQELAQQQSAQPQPAQQQPAQLPQQQHAPAQVAGEAPARTAALDKQQQPADQAAPQRQSQAPAEHQGVVLAPADRMAMFTPGRLKPAMPFVEAKGLLPLPVQGKRVLNFGDKTQYGSQSKGIVMQTRQGAQVVSPTDGWVSFAGDFRSYGKLLIISAGGGYHILLAGLSQIDAQPGQFLLAGEAVGVMPSSGSAPTAKAQDNAPVLYIEFRKDKQPVDPEPWWVPASRKVKS